MSAKNSLLVAGVFLLAVHAGGDRTAQARPAILEAPPSSCQTGGDTACVAPAMTGDHGLVKIAGRGSAADPNSRSRAGPPAPGQGGWPKGALYFLQQSINAIKVSAFYALLAVAYVLLYGTVNRINLAFGATAMCSAYLTISGVTIIFAVSTFGLATTLVLGLAYALTTTAILGFAVQRTVIKPLRSATTVAVLIATIGLAIVLEEVMRIASGSRVKWLSPILDRPILIVDSAEFSVQITQMQVIIVVAAMALSIGLIVFVYKHKFGRAWRACAQDLEMAALCGIDVDRTLGQTFLISSAYAAAAGAIIALYYGGVSFHMGTVLGLKALLAAVIGGLHSLGGAFLGALILGFLESYWSAYFDIEDRDVVVLAVLALVMILRPNGLLTPSVRRDWRLG